MSCTITHPAIQCPVAPQQDAPCHVTDGSSTAAAVSVGGQQVHPCKRTPIGEWDRWVQMMTATLRTAISAIAWVLFFGCEGGRKAQNSIGLPMKTELTGAQVRMARAFLRWSVTDLAAKANVGISTVQRIEAADDPAVRDDLDWRASARGQSIQAIRETLIGAGITLLLDDGKGVGVRGKTRLRRPPRLNQK